LEARDAYHVHLSHLSNVVGTAIGRYLIREDDWYATHPPSEPRPANVEPAAGERTLFNSMIKDWSWPCVLVFVNEWWNKNDFGESPDQMVPRALFFPEAVSSRRAGAGPRGTSAEPLIGALSFPDSYVGGGYVALTDVQGRRRRLDRLPGHQRQPDLRPHESASPARRHHLHDAPRPEDRAGFPPRTRSTAERSPTCIRAGPAQRAVAPGRGLIRVDDLSGWTRCSGWDLSTRSWT
jgi:hypothetical protein